jgi:thiamine pyrophosphate-dependent acetolactate synthase large subunit-like protein
MSKKVAEVIVETLASAGVKHCYGIVGDTLNRIAYSIPPASFQPCVPHRPRRRLNARRARQ